MASPATLPSYTSSTAEKPLLGMTIGDKFDQIAAQYPDNDALIALHQNIHWSYRELQQEVNRCARALLAIGVQKGDRVGIWAPNCSEWTLTQFATAKIGAILVNINPMDPNGLKSFPVEESTVKFACRRTDSGNR